MMQDSLLTGSDRKSF